MFSALHIKSPKLSLNIEIEKTILRSYGATYKAHTKNPE
jgi:hypothetical protein